MTVDSSFANDLQPSRHKSTEIVLVLRLEYDLPCSSFCDDYLDRMIVLIPYAHGQQFGIRRENHLRIRIVAFCHAQVDHLALQRDDIDDADLLALVEAAGVVAVVRGEPVCAGEGKVFRGYHQSEPAAGEQVEHADAVRAAGEDAAVHRL